jgi:trans-aconitate methyltransferase
MGPGKDLDLLVQLYKVTGSDSSQVLLDLYRENHELADLIKLDARTLIIDRRFNCIYSNQVLHHLSEGELLESFQRQSHLLNPSGILFHSFWYGDLEEFMHGLRNRYSSEELLLSMVEPLFEVLVITKYQEIDPDDSLYMDLEKREVIK